MINDQDSQGLRDISNEQLKDVLTDDVFSEIYTAIGEGGQYGQIEKINIDEVSSNGQDYHCSRCQSEI